MKILVTGADGFIGSRLLTQLASAQGLAADLCDSTAIREVLRGKKWDVVVHLGAISTIQQCEKDPDLAFAVNVGGTRHLLEALRDESPAAHFIFASTAQVYGAPTQAEIASGEVVFDENRSLVPQNMYAKTKREAEILVQESGLRASILRIFNHSHRSQSPLFFLPHIYQGILEAKNSGKKEIPVGNLDLYRDIGSLSDFIAALLALTARPERLLSGVDYFNICSGRAKHLGTLARKISEALAYSVDFVVDPSRVRSNEPKVILGSHEKLTRATGWSPVCLTEDDLIRSFLA